MSDRTPALLTAVLAIVFALMNPWFALGVFVWCRLNADGWEV